MTDFKQRNAIKVAKKLLETSSVKSYDGGNVLVYEGKFVNDEFKVVFDRGEQILIVSSSLDIEDCKSIMMIVNMEGEEPTIDFFRKEDSSAWVLGLEICLMKETI